MMFREKHMALIADKTGEIGLIISNRINEIPI